jgi:hypothetical protein
MRHEHGDGQAPWMRNAGKMFSPASLVFRQFITLSLASAFRHHGQSSTASLGLVSLKATPSWRMQLFLNFGGQSDYAE